MISQVLRGPLPQTTKLSRDWVHLHKLNILPGLRVDGDKRKTERRDKVRKAGGSHPGELFSSISPLAARIDQVRHSAHADASHGVATHPLG
jgi:hypothetical protein